MLEPTNTMPLCDIQMQALQFCLVFGTLFATFAWLTTRDNCNVVIMRKSHINGTFAAENVTSKMDFVLFATDEHVMMPRWTHVTAMSVVMCLCLFVHASLGFVLCGVVASLYFVGFASSRWSDMFAEMCNMQSCLTETFKCIRLMLGTLLTLSVETVATSCVCMWWYVMPSLFEVAPGACPTTMLADPPTCVDKLRVTIQYKAVPSALHEVYRACVGSAPEAWLVFQDSDVLIALLLFKFATDLVLIFDARESKIVCVPSFVTGLVLRLKALAPIACISQVANLRMLLRTTPAMDAVHTGLTVSNLSLAGLLNPLISLALDVVAWIPGARLLIQLMFSDTAHVLSTSSTGSAWIQQASFATVTNTASHDTQDSLFVFVCVRAAALLWILTTVMASEHPDLCRAAWNSAKAALYLPHRPTLRVATAVWVLLALLVPVWRYSAAGFARSAVVAAPTLWKEWPVVLVQALLVDLALNAAFLLLLAVGTAQRAMGAGTTRTKFVSTSFASTHPQHNSPNVLTHWFAHTEHFYQQLPSVQAWIWHDSVRSSIVMHTLQKCPLASQDLARACLAAPDWSTHFSILCHETAHRVLFLVDTWATNQFDILYATDLAQTQTLQSQQRQAQRNLQRTAAAAAAAASIAPAVAVPPAAPASAVPPAAPAVAPALAVPMLPTAPTAPQVAPAVPTAPQDAPAVPTAHQVAPATDPAVAVDPLRANRKSKVLWANPLTHIQQQAAAGGADQRPAAAGATLVCQCTWLPRVGLAGPGHSSAAPHTAGGAAADAVRGPRRPADVPAAADEAAAPARRADARGIT